MPKVGDRVKRARFDERGPNGEGKVVEILAREHMHKPRPKALVKWDGVRKPRCHFADSLQVLESGSE